jgi:hypothetical protein
MKWIIIALVLIALFIITYFICQVIDEIEVNNENIYIEQKKKKK